MSGATICAEISFSRLTAANITTGSGRRGCSAAVVASEEFKTASCPGLAGRLCLPGVESPLDTIPAYQGECQERVNVAERDSRRLCAILFVSPLLFTPWLSGLPRSGSSKRGTAGIGATT